MKSDAEIRQEGMRALIRSLGPVEAERFVASISKDRFNYTEWRRTALPEIDLADLSRRAAFSKQHQNLSPKCAPGPEPFPILKTC